MVAFVCERSVCEWLECHSPWSDGANASSFSLLGFKEHPEDLEEPVEEKKASVALSEGAFIAIL